MKNELISMVELIDQYRGKFYTKSYNDLTIEMVQKLDLYENYANFLNTPLNISMFVPAIKVGDKWEVLEEPKERNYNMGDIHGGYFRQDLEQYQTAKDNVIFEGEFTRNHIESFAYHISRNRTIEYLVPFDITLTKKGVELSGLNR